VTRHRNENKLRAALEDIWRNTRPEAISRLAALESFLEKQRSGRADDECLDAARTAAHRLAGVLGMFGLEEGSSCAARIEGLLWQEPVSDTVLLGDLVHHLRHLMEGKPASMKTQERRDL